MPVALFHPPPTQKTPTQQTKRAQRNPIQLHKLPSIVFVYFLYLRQEVYFRRHLAGLQGHNISAQGKASGRQPQSAALGSRQMGRLRSVKGTTILQGMDRGD